MCLVKYSLFLCCFLIFDAYALTCRSEGGPKESELKSIYKKCLKMQEGKNSSNRDSGDQDSRRQRNDWDGHTENVKGKHNKMGNRNDRRGMDDRMGTYNDRSSEQNVRMGSPSDRMGHSNDRMGNRDDRMGGFGDWSDSYDRMGSRDSRMNGDSRSQDPMENRYGRNEHLNGRNDFQHEFGSEPPSHYGHQSTQAPHRFKRKSENSGNRSQFNPNSKRYHDSNRSDERSSNERNISKDDDKKDCALHCFLENMEMTAEDGLPDRYLVTHALTKDVNNEDLKDFLQESIEECFQILDNEHTDNKCEFSKNLLMCLSEKGRESCDDWKDDLRF